MLEQPTDVSKIY